MFHRHPRSGQHTSRHRWYVAVLLTFILLLVAGFVTPPAVTTSAATSATTLYAPIVPQQVQLTESFPAVLDVDLTITCLDSDLPDLQPEPGAQIWTFNCYRVDAGEQNGAWDLVLDVRAKQVQTFGQIGESDGRELRELAQRNAVIRPMAKVCASRIEAFRAPDGARYIACFPSTTGRAVRLHIERRPAVPQ